MKSFGKTTTDGIKGFKPSDQGLQPAVFQSKPISKGLPHEVFLTKGVKKNLPQQSMQRGLDINKKPEELLNEVNEMKRKTYEMECLLKHNVNEIKRYHTEITFEKEVTTPKLRSEMERLEQEKKEVQEKIKATLLEHEKTKEKLRNTEDVLEKRERYITVLVHENPDRLKIQEQFKVFDLPNRDNMKRTSIAQRDSIKRNSVATSTLKQFQANNIA
jgi:hypothetical protein